MDSNQDHIISPLAPESFPKIYPILGMSVFTAAAGVKYQNRDDLLCVRFDKPAVVTAVFTQSNTAACSVEYGRKLLHSQKNANALLVVAGSANAFTGKAGEDAQAHIIQALANQCNIDASRIYHSATGVIGEVLPADKVISGFKNLQQGDFQTAAKAITTTDTFAKGASKQITLSSGDVVTISGIAKGSGMIAPNMATMLGYIFTDADIDQPLLQNILQGSVDQTFNAITVDSDTSTNDTVMAFATGKVPLQDEDIHLFSKAFQEVCHDLAIQIVKDGEGAQKFITVNVSGAQTDADAKKIAFSIANSPLVKTAIAGEDANWGRIVMAVGKTDAVFDQSNLGIHIGGVLVAQNGTVAPNYNESMVTDHMTGADIMIEVSIGAGQGSFTAYTCDLTHGYISINADYRS